MRHTAGRVLIRSLLDIRLSRLSMAALGVLSVAATVFILAGGSGRSNAQVAALAALRQRPVTVAQVTPPAATPAPPAASVGDQANSSGDGGGDSSSRGGGSSSDAGTPATSDTGSSTPAASDTGSGSDTSTTSTTTSSSTTSSSSSLPKVGHVFEIVLSAPSYAAAFGRGSAAAYLRSIESKGTLLSGYESLGEGELADELAMVGGQAPNADTRAGCTTYTEFPQGTSVKTDGAVPGAGCVYPEAALTLGDQVTASGHNWRAYIADMGSSSCVHPNSNAVDNVALPGTGTGYDTRHNPFIYFHSLLDLGDCATDDLDLTHLDKALAKSSRTATFSFIAPNACADATAVVAPSPADGTSTTSTSTTSTTTTSTTTTSTTTTSTTTSTATPPAGSTTASGTSTAAPTPSAATTGCPSDQPVGIAAEDAFLKQWVPKILTSSAYRTDGVLVIAFTGSAAENPGHATRAGALVISRYARSHRTVPATYDPYSLLRSVEDMLGYAGLAHAKRAPSFAAKVLVRN